MEKLARLPKERGQARLPDPELITVESGACIERLADKISGQL
jgi:hypothetical protein